MAENLVATMPFTIPPGILLFCWIWQATRNNTLAMAI
jgi:hypothetical protein